MTPSRKWLAARVVAVHALAVMYLTTGSWDVEESIALVGLLSEAAVSYLVPNRG